MKKFIEMTVLFEYDDEDNEHVEEQLRREHRDFYEGLECITMATISMKKVEL